MISGTRSGELKVLCKYVAVIYAVDGIKILVEGTTLSVYSILATSSLSTSTMLDHAERSRLNIGKVMWKGQEEI
jgi:hypothetical protein